MQIQFSFHYSDYWSNGSTQIIPASWQKEIEGKTAAEAVNILEKLVYDYTKDVMQKLAAQSTTPEYVSLGNEMQSGLLYPLGKATDDCWPNLARFLRAGYRAVKEVSPSTQVILHLDDAGNDWKYNTFFDNCAKYEKELNGRLYDVIGTSYYPFWTSMGVQQIVDFCDKLIEKYGRDIILMETGFAFDDFLPSDNTNRGQLYHNKPYSGSGEGLNSTSEALQREFMMELFNGLKAIGLNSTSGARCIGDLYWDPILVEQSGVGWAMREDTDTADVNVVSNTTLFGFDHQLLPVMDAYRYNKEGSATGEVTGKVVNNENKPVAGVTFTLLGSTVTTDLYGTFRISDVAAGSKTPDVNGMTANPGSVTVTAGEAAHLTLTMATASLSGTVKDAAGKPLTGATVTAKSSSVTQTAVTGADGSYSFTAIPNGTYKVSAELTGYQLSEEKTVTVNSTAATAELSMTLVSGVVVGTVKDEDGKPLEGVSVSAGAGLTAVTGADGSYTISGLASNQDYTLSFTKSGYVRNQITCKVAAGTTAQMEDVILSKNEGRLKFRVVDVDGKPIVGAKAEILWTAEATSDSDGYVTLDKRTNDTPLNTGTYAVDISAKNYVGRTVEFTVGSGAADGGTVVLPKPVTLKNPSFHSADGGWTMTSDPEGAVIYQDRTYQGGAYDDNDALSFWAASAFKASASQVIALMREITSSGFTLIPDLPMMVSTTASFMCM